MTRLESQTSMHRKNWMLTRITRGVAMTGALLIVACDSPTVPQFNNTTKEVAANDPSSLQLLATGLLAQNRGTVQGRISAFGRLGRESFVYTPTEGRNTTHFLQGPGPLDPSGFAAASFGPYGNLRDVDEFLKVVEGLTVLNAVPVTEAQKDAGRGFGKTIYAQELLSIISALDTIGAVVEVREDPRDLAPFVSRDSVYRHITGLLDEAKANLDAAGTTAFPFALHSGYAGFNTPATYARFNRAIAAQASVYHGSLGCGVPCYTKALTALSQSFINPTGPLRAGPFHPFSTATGDAQNNLFFSTASDLVAHPSIQTDAQLRANGSRDLRLNAKTDTATPVKAATPSGAGISTSVRFKLYADRSAPIPIITNEELILLRSEARWFTGDKLGAIQDLDIVRQTSGGLPPSTLTIASSDAEYITALLYERRYSLLLEGRRWIDHRRFGRLSSLPLDIPTHFVARVQPIPQGECLIRVNETTPALRGPGCP